MEHVEILRGPTHRGELPPFPFLNVTTPKSFPETSSPWTELRVFSVENFMTPFLEGPSPLFSQNFRNFTNNISVFSGHIDVVAHPTQLYFLRLF